MTRTFISYRRDDTRATSSRIYDKLAGAFGGSRVFKDVNTIPAGEDFREYIQREIAKADAVLVIIGSRWETILAQRADDERDFVRLEIESAFQQNKRVIPLLVEGATAPKEGKLPESIRKLAYLNAATVNDDPFFHRDMEDVIRLLRATSPRMSKRLLATMAGALLVLVVAGALVFSVFSASTGGSGTPIASTPLINTPNPETAASITSFGGMWLYDRPASTANIVGSTTDNALIAGRNSDNSYYLIQHKESFAWVRANTFTRINGDVNTIPIVDFVAVYHTPTPRPSSTPRPAPTTRPTAAFAQGWAVMNRDNFDVNFLPSLWSAYENTNFGIRDGILSVVGNSAFSDVYQYGYFDRTGAVGAFRFSGDDLQNVSVQLVRGVFEEEGYNAITFTYYEGLVQLHTTEGAGTPQLVREFPLRRDTWYVLRLTLEGDGKFNIVISERETSLVAFLVTLAMGEAWAATPATAYTLSFLPVRGTIEVDWVERVLQLSR